MFRSIVTAAAVLAASVSAQTMTDCNPLNVTCPADMALGISNYTWDAAGSTAVDWAIWNNTGGIDPTFSSNSVDFTLKESGNAPGIQSQFYYFFGTVTVMLKAATGTGIISAVTSLSDDLDEIDWEFKGGNESFVFTNYYGKYYPGLAGNGTDVSLGFDPRADFHNYTTVWSNTSLEWYVDGRMVRQLLPQDAEGGARYPQTPMRLHIDAWAGGDAKEPVGTQQWAGGQTDYSQGPFIFSVQSIYVSDASTGSSYTYTDKSGSWESIKTAAGNSTIANYIGQQSDHKTVSQHWSDLTPGAKIGIAVTILVFLGIGALVMAICCIKQRRAGRRERALADAEYQKQEAEQMEHRMKQQNGAEPGFYAAEFKN